MRWRDGRTDGWAHEHRKTRLLTPVYTKKMCIRIILRSYEDGHTGQTLPAHHGCLAMALGGVHWAFLGSIFEVLGGAPWKRFAS